MEILKTASVGLVRDITGKRYIQVIMADTEYHFFFPLTAFEAKNMSENEDIEIAQLDYEI